MYNKIEDWRKKNQKKKFMKIINSSFNFYKD